MSTNTSDNRQSSNSTGHYINAGIDSTFRNDPIHRGSLSPLELHSIHQTESFKQAKQLEDEDNHKLATKLKQIERSKKSTQ